MISLAEKKNPIVANYDKIVCAIGVVALVLGGVFFATSGGDERGALLGDAEQIIDWKAPADLGIKPVDLTLFAAQTRATTSPQTIAELTAGRESFLASEKRVKCACGKVMPAGLETCPACNISLVTVNKVDEEAKVAEQWAKKYGVTLDDSDADNDGFTNLEELAMGTDPTDAKSHADYLDSVKIQLPLKETFVPFYLKAVNKIPAGFRCEFAQGKATFSATVGETLVITKTSGVGKESKLETGFKLIDAKKEEKKVSMKGVAGTRTVDASAVTIERIADGKKIELQVQLGKKPKLAPVDQQATLVYERNGVKTFDVVTGGEIDLNGSKYAVQSVKAVGKGAEVVLKSKETDKIRIIKALD